MFTPEEYLTLERSTDTKSEWVDGEIYAMAGGSESHRRIQSNINGILHRQLQGRDCEFFGSDTKVRSRLSSMRGLFTYPDGVVVCGQPYYHDMQTDVLVNPRVVFEVLSPSTEEYDKGDKRLRYQTIPSLNDYVLVAQDEPAVEHWVRDGEGNWVATKLTGLGLKLQLDSIGCSLPLSDIYDRIKWVT